jgi:hypothetical protein
MSVPPFPSMLCLAVPPAEAAARDLAPATARQMIDRPGIPAAERVRLAGIGSRALLAAACNELLMRGGAPA